MPARRRTPFLCALIVCGHVAPALAQTSAPITNYAACTGKPTPQDSEAAHNAFLLGKRFFDEADYGSAIHNFVDAYKLDCTKTELLLTIARANELAGNKADAVHALQTYLDRAPNASAEDKAQIQKRIDNLNALIAAQATPAPAVAPAPPPVVAPAPATTAPTPPPPEARSHTAAPWVLTAIGGASFVAGGVIWLVGHGSYSTASTECGPSHTCPNSQDASSGDSGLTLMNVGGGVFIGGAALVAGGLIWHFVEPTGPADEKKAAVEPVLVPGYAGVTGRF